jgi:hypothetical protein
MNRTEVGSDRLASACASEAGRLARYCQRVESFSARSIVAV